MCVLISSDQPGLERACQLQQICRLPRHVGDPTRWQPTLQALAEPVACSLARQQKVRV